MFKWLNGFLKGNFEGEAGFKGNLSIKIMRAKPTMLSRITDFLRGHK